MYYINMHGSFIRLYFDTIEQVKEYLEFHNLFKLVYSQVSGKPIMERKAHVRTYYVSIVE